jgi:putative membrane protein
MVTGYSILVTDLALITIYGSLVINTIIVLLASEFAKVISIDNFWWGLLFSLLLSIATSFLNRELERDESF